MTSCPRWYFRQKTNSLHLLVTCLSIGTDSLAQDVAGALAGALAGPLTGDNVWSYSFSIDSHTGIPSDVMLHTTGASSAPLASCQIPAVLCTHCNGTVTCPIVLYTSTVILQLRTSQRRRKKSLSILNPILMSSTSIKKKTKKNFLVFVSTNK